MAGTSASSAMFAAGLALGPVAVLLLLWAVNAVLAPRNPTEQKLSAYECGIPQGGDPWPSLNVRYTTYALLFVIFDAETVLLFAVVSRLHSTTAALIEVAVFTLFLAFGLFYAWKRGALQWRS